MATEFLSHVKVGGLGNETVLIDCISDEFIEMWSPVIYVTKGTGEDLPRVEPNGVVASATVAGVACGPLRENPSATYTYGRCADAAGQPVQVATFGRVKCKVDGTDGIDISDGLVTHDADGVAQLAAVDVVTANNTELQLLFQHIAAVFAKALEASTADLDVIPVFVTQAIGTIT